MKYSKKQLEKAFEQWTIDCRVKPSEFLSNEEVTNLDAKELAKENVKVLIDYIKNK